MSFRWLPVPHVDLVESGAGAEIALNLTLYGLGLGIAGACVWLAGLAWLDRAR
jgi:hypothetical protein